VPRKTTIIGILGILLYIVGCYDGLLVAPADRFMGDIQRIMYVHVPCAWNTLVCFTISLVAALGWLLSGARARAEGRAWKWDELLEATTEIGVVLGAFLIVQGMLWAKPTWGVYWTWDPRLTTVAVMELMFVAVLALRGFVDEPVRRATWSAVVTLVAYVNVPLVYFSVKWWASLHQVQSSPSTVDPAMVLPLRINAFAVLFMSIGLMGLRTQLARRQRQALLAETDSDSTASAGGAA
jgi:heme exporter protein C